MSRAKRVTKAQRTRKQPAAVAMPESAQRTVEIAAMRLNRANDLLNAIDHIATVGAGEVNLGALAIAARDLVDKVLEDLSAFNRDLRGLIATMEVSSG